MFKASMKTWEVAMPKYHIAVVAALESLVAAKKKWFENNPSVQGLKSDQLQKFVTDIYDSNRDYEEIRVEYENDEDTLFPPVSTNYLFKEPKILTNVKIWHYTDSEPSGIVDAIQKGKFKGCNYEDIGLTKHHGCSESGPLGFGFKAGASGRLYGRNRIEFTALEAVEAYHESDSEQQIIWDADYIKDLKVGT